MEITRRQLLGGALGLVGAGLLEACGSPPTGFSFVQSTEGVRVTTGRSIAVRYAHPVQTGSLLVAVVTRSSSSTLAPTIGQVSDDAGNHWRQAVEFFADGHFGVDLWYCESAGGGNRPTVRAVGLDYPPLPGITGMNMQVVEYSGATGFELCDQIGQARISGPSVASATNFALAADHELAISVVMGDMATAAVPPGWNRRLADTTQRCWVADNLDTGTTSAGLPLAARWTGLTGATGAMRGVAVVATFVPKGVPATHRRLVQSSYTDSAVLPAGAGHPAWTSQPFPVNPTRGNSLVAFMNGSIYHPEIQCGTIEHVTDSAGGQWHKLAESGPDDRTGINISCWMCPYAPGGPTALTATFSNDSQQLACLLLEFANLPSNLQVAGVERRTDGGDVPPLSMSSPLAAGDIALAYRTSIFVLPQGPGSTEWHQILSDTTGANALMVLDTVAGPLTATWSGSVVQDGLDVLLLALRPSA